MPIEVADPAQKVLADGDALREPMHLSTLAGNAHSPHENKRFTNVHRSKASTSVFVLLRKPLRRDRSAQKLESGWDKVFEVASRWKLRN